MPPEPEGRGFEKPRGAIFGNPRKRELKNVKEFCRLRPKFEISLGIV